MGKIMLPFPRKICACPNPQTLRARQVTWQRGVKGAERVKGPTHPTLKQGDCSELSRWALLNHGSLNVEVGGKERDVLTLKMEEGMCPEAEWPLDTGKGQGHRCP
jgi:hypothetical protein